MQNKGFVKVFCGITHAGMRVLPLFLLRDSPLYQ